MAATIGLVFALLIYQWAAFLEEAAGRQPKDLKPIRRRRRVAPQPVYRYTSLSTKQNRRSTRQKED